MDQQIIIIIIIGISCILLSISLAGGGYYYSTQQTTKARKDTTSTGTTTLPPTTTTSTGKTTLPPTTTTTTSTGKTTLPPTTTTTTSTGTTTLPPTTTTTTSTGTTTLPPTTTTTTSTGTTTLPPTTTPTTGTSTRTPVTVGKNVKCTSNIPAGKSGDTVYRWDGDNLRAYPSPDIANSWDANWASTTTNIDCAGFTVGTDLEKIGKSVKCTSNIPTGKSGDTIYRWDGKTLRGYPNPDIANSWDANWESTTNIDCAGFTVGTNMAAKPDVGKSVKCTSNIPEGKTGDTIYRWDGSNLRAYPSETIATSWDPTYYSGGVLDIDCDGFTVGTNMAINPETQYRYLCNEHNKCLTQGGTNQAFQASVNSYYGDRQKWKFDGKHICNPNNKCLAAAGNSSGWGGQYVLWDKKEEDGQRWTLGDNKSLCNALGGCMGSPSNTAAENADLIQWGFVGDAAQKWSWRDA
jgi:hypothetical protein